MTLTVAEELSAMSTQAPSLMLAVARCAETPRKTAHQSNHELQRDAQPEMVECMLSHAEAWEEVVHQWRHELRLDSRLVTDRWKTRCERKWFECVLPVHESVAEICG